ncbi:MAG: demethoxyubiquinone hydroxylase family protein [Pseudohongiellaceae bacterium]
MSQSLMDQDTDLQRWLTAELRSDHAGETGAVWIYKGILAVSRNRQVRDFSAAHLETEQGHLALISEVLAPDERSWFLPIWRLAGFATGALPALFGANAVFATIAAVETFVDGHYQQQIDRLRDEPAHADIRALLIACQEDEVNHRDEARDAQLATPGMLLKSWCWLVGAGSEAAVSLARWR